MASIKNDKPLNESLKNYARGIAGGLLFSFPLLYTMEVWWAGFIVPPFALLIVVFTTFLVLIGYNTFAGIRPDASWREVIIDSFEEMGLGLVLSFGMLLMLHRIDIGNMAIDEMIGKVVIEAMAASIGISVGTAQLGAGKGGGKKNEKQANDGDNKKKDEKEDKKNNKSAYIKKKAEIVVLAICGGIIIGANVAPTQEVLMIAVEADPVHILVMAVFSLFISVVVVYFSDFKGSAPKKPDNLTYEITFNTCLCYLVALSTSAFFLWFFGHFENISFWNAFSQVIVLGVLSSLGASAGRLLIK